MMRLIAAAILLPVLFFSAPANAQTFSDNYPQAEHWFGNVVAPQVRMAGRSGGLGPKPRAWCGWWLRKHTGRLDPDLNRARAWLKYPRTAPRPGAIVVWARGNRGGGHVGKIVQVTGNCTALVISGNDGGAVRTRERNICNALGIVS